MTALTVLPEDPGLIHSTRMEAQNRLQLIHRRPQGKQWALLWLSGSTVEHTHMLAVTGPTVKQNMTKGGHPCLDPLFRVVALLGLVSEKGF